MDGSELDVNVERYKISPGHAAGLINRPTRVEPLYALAQDYQAQLKDHTAKLSELQELFHAANQDALLIIVQGMDASGKDGTISHVMSGINPQGCDVFSFKQPSAEELEHDFLWRTYQDLPKRGKIGIFNRSYYEEVLVIRVHPEMLHSEGIPKSKAMLRDVWLKRYRSINALEQHLFENDTRIIKLFLHVSEEEQINRFLARIDTPGKNWKLGSSDIKERKFWQDYTAAYEACISATSTHEAPWWVIPADEKDLSRLIVSQILLNTLSGLRMSYPGTTPERHRELAAIRSELVAVKAHLQDKGRLKR